MSRTLSPRGSFTQIGLFRIVAGLWWIFGDSDRAVSGDTTACVAGLWASCVFLGGDKYFAHLYHPRVIFIVV